MAHQLSTVELDFLESAPHRFVFEAVVPASQRLVFGAIIGLTWLHADTGIILTTLALLGVGGIGAGVAAVHGKVNGNLEALVSSLRDAMDKLYNATPPAPPKDSDTGDGG